MLCSILQMALPHTHICSVLGRPQGCVEVQFHEPCQLLSLHAPWRLASAVFLLLSEAWSGLPCQRAPRSGLCSSTSFCSSLVVFLFFSVCPVLYFPFPFCSPLGLHWVHVQKSVFGKRGLLCSRFLLHIHVFCARSDLLERNMLPTLEKKS